MWWQWRSPSSGTATIDTAGSSFDTILSVYTGTRVDRLTELAESDNGNPFRQQSRVMIDVSEGTTYWIRVAGFLGDTGQIVLNWNLEEPKITFEHKYIFPQFPYGGGWSSTLTVLDKGDGGPTTCRFTTVGRPIPGKTEPEFILNLDERNGHVWRTGWGGSLSSGMAMLECDNAVWTHVLFSLRSDGSIVSEALVEPAPEDNFVLFVADHRGGSRFGVAVANPSDQQIEVTVSVTGLNEAEDRTEINIPARDAKAFFLDELYDIPKDHLGVVAMWSDDTNSLHVIGLRFTGQVFTTIPAW